MSGEWEQVFQNVKICGADKNFYANILENIENLSLELDLEKRTTEIITEKYIGEKPEVINLFIKGQPSLLIAPNISNTENAIPIPILAELIENLGLGATPNLKQTLCLIKSSALFNLTTLIYFKQDKIAKETCKWFIEYLAAKSKQSKNRSLPTPSEQLDGKHLELLGVKIGNYIFSLSSFNKFIKPIKNRKLETVAMQLLEELKQQQKEMDSEKRISRNYY